jgi:nitroreductase
MLIDAIARRRSAVAFDPTHALAPEEMTTLLEAARWAPSAMNRQPWAFLVGHRGDTTFKAVADALSGNNQLWAPAASVLMVAMVDNGSRDQALSAGRAYELGLAVGQLGVQADAMGLITHQMGGFDAERLMAELAIPRHLVPLVVVAVGVPGDPEMLPGHLRDREAAPRVRRPQDSWVFTRGWEESD